MGHTDRAALIAWAKEAAKGRSYMASEDGEAGFTESAIELQEEADHFDAIAALLEAGQQLERLVGDLQAHAKDAGWQDVDDPIAALLALALTGDATEGQG